MVRDAVEANAVRLPPGRPVRRAGWVRAISILVSLVTIIVIGVLGWRSLASYRALHGEVEHTQQVLLDLERLGSALKDAEAGQRGFVISGDPTFLVPYDEAAEQIPQILRQLREETSDNPTQQRRLNELDQVVAEKMRLVALLIEQRRSGNGAVDLSRLNHSRTLMDRIRSVIGTMNMEERRLYAQRVGKVNEQADQLVIIAALGAIMSLGLTVLGFAAAGREVNRRQQAEANLKAANQELEQRVNQRSAELTREMAERERLGRSFETVVEYAPFPLIGLDRNANIFLWNRAAEENFGYSLEEVLGKPYPLTPAGKEKEFRVGFERALAGNVVRNHPIQRQHKNGKPVDLLTSSAALRDDKGEIYAVIFALQNVTERLLMAKQLQQAQRMEAIGQLTGGIAHDFNNLLGVVVGNLDLIVEQTREADTKEMADAALKGALRGSDLVQRLLAFARKQPLEPKVIDLNERLPSLKALLQRTIGGNITVRTSAAGDLWPVIADPAQVEDALMNLAINARDAMPDGGSLIIETANVMLDEAYAARHAETKAGEYVMIAVTDTGTGIPQDILDHVFEPFFTTKDTGKGSGLGLSMVYGFAKQSSGHVKIYSEAGHGTTVKLYLPRARDRREIETPIPAQDVVVPTGGETILLVEDDEAVRQTATRMLKGLGYRVHTADSGPAALAMLDADDTRYDLLFTDIIMPAGMNGFDLLVAVRQRYPDIHVLMTSGYTEEALRRTRSVDAAVQILGKPYRREELARAVRRALEA